MRKYEVAALLPDLSLAMKQQIAPAIPLFEEACSAFARGTLIQTARGPIAIEDLLPGDYIETSRGVQSVTWIGSTTYVPGVRSERSALDTLTRVTAEAYGVGRPGSDLLLGPAARMVVKNAKLRSLLGKDSVMVPVSDEADWDRIVPVTPGGAVQLYHLMVQRHATIRVGGIEMETYHPGTALSALSSENMRALFLSMFENIEGLQDFGELSMMRSTREALDQLIEL
ncbi:type I secretion protein [Salipiger sp. CCB-MM3]|uniref:Hint domain-containing protein n=1 Tax=Roseobacteraceae TaxID=2854170 RepID=UPI00080ABD19|nr:MULTISPECIES: Hint domain-containing protein [Roseobacteraceae]ANT60642.1 type I secretion protein [Salipiger sp. CCB-MM3]MCA0995961.1 Hint domain-containing protein [Alloyangia pacifica]